ncbi:MAG: Uncharacterised protein [Hyphomonas sp. TMED17]|nr:MAG: Uncharacterised protein [Hyphomonas sp. TMED17]
MIAAWILPGTVSPDPFGYAAPYLMISACLITMRQLTGMIISGCCARGHPIMDFMHHGIGWAGTTFSLARTTIGHKPMRPNFELIIRSSSA